MAGDSPRAGRGPSSLRARLTAIYTVALALPLVVFAIASYLVFERALLARSDRFITDALGVFTREAGAERMQAASARAAIRTTVNEVRFRDVRIIVRDSAGALVAMASESDAGTGGDGDRVLAAIVASAPDSGAFTIPGANGGDRVITRAVVIDAERFRVSGAYPLGDLVAVLERIRTMFLVAIPLLIVAAAAGAWVLARRSLAPVSAMAARAGAITANNLDQRLPVAGGAELTQLAAVFNALLDRAENALSQQRRFMADASHEMRTPIATLKAEAEVTLAREHRTEAEYRESVGVMLQAVQRLSRLVDDLFLLARADAGHLVMHAEPVYLEEIVHDAVRAVVQVGERRGVHVELRHMTQAPFLGDRGLLERLLLNLLDNAIKYSATGSTVDVIMEHGATTHEIAVVDHGVGIAPEAAGQVFERFYRGDASRTRSSNSVTDGAGLGLAIARRIALAHGGSLTLESSAPGRTEFRLRLPA
jgi:heavy metal sensor kinase